MKLKFILIAWIVLHASNSFAQQTMPGRILFLIKSEAITAFRAAFASPEIHTLKFDPQKFSLKDSKAISALLALPSTFHVTSVKPLIPQHNVVLEELRERTNPILFPKTNQDGINIKESEDIIKLKTSEEHISRWFELFYDTTISLESAQKFLKKSGIVECAEPRYRYSLCFTPNDPDFSQQYALPLMHLPEAWDIVRCDSTMLIADDDIGTDWTHSDLANAIFVNSGETGLDSNGFDKRSNGIDDDGDGFVDDWHGWDFAGDDGTAPDNDPNTQATHGTHTAGIMAASGNNGIGICGVAFGAKVLILKCGDNTGSDVSFGYEGIIYAADHGAKVVNNSWGGTNRSQVGQDIINYATGKNCVVVAASGNSSAFLDFYPSSYDHVLSVAAVDATDRITDFSNYNTHVDLSAPGLDVLSTVPNEGYEIMSGTSMASPNAAGAIALVRQRFPDLDPDQAVERLRATCDQLDATHDIHPGYTGKGSVNVLRAITDNPLYSARLESFEIFDQNNDGSLNSGQSADIVLHVRNYLSPVTDLQATIEYLDDTAQAISANTQTVDFGKANTLSLVQNFQGSFHVTISPKAPENYTVLVKLTYSSDPEKYGPDVDYFYLVINKGYLDLNKNNLTVTFNSKGSIGYDDSPDNSQGSGFIWTNAPPSIAPNGRDVLFEGGLMIASDPQHIVAAAPSEANDQIAEEDYSPIINLHYVTPTDHPNAAQELSAIFADGNTDTSLQVGVTVAHKMYAFTKDLSANAVVVDYVIHKRIVDSVSYLTDSTSVALFMDWDIGASGSINQAYLSAFDTTISVTKRLEDSYPYLGIKLISDIPNGAALNFYALDNDGSNGSAKTYGGFAQSDKWLTMTTSRPSAGIGDVSIVQAVKNLPLRSRDSVRLTYILAIAESEELLKQTIDQTTIQWFGESSVRNSSPLENTLHLSPNPFGNHLHIAWETNTSDLPAEITFTDAIGRTVFSQIMQGQEFDITKSSLPAGAYTVTIRQGNIVLHKQAISLP